MSRVALVLAAVSFAMTAQRVVVRHEPAMDWPQFGWDSASSGVLPGASGITPENAASLVRRQVHLDGTVDSSAIYLHGVIVRGSAHDVFFVTTTYGKTIAIDAGSGTV